MSDVDIIIPTKGKIDILTKCLASIIEHTTIDYHVHIADTGSTQQEMHDMVRFVKNAFGEKRNASIHKYNYYNFAKINNDVVQKFCTNDMLLFCNNDIELRNNCVDHMVAEASKQTTGTVGCRLLYENNTIQHAGQIAIEYTPKDWPYEFDALGVTHRGIGQTKKYSGREKVMGNTAALMCISKQKFESFGRYNTNYVECFEDVELNWRVLLAGYDNVYLDDCHATHFESLTRTKTKHAIDKVNKEFIYNLFPFWKNLSRSDQLKILSYKT